MTYEETVAQMLDKNKNPKQVLTDAGHGQETVVTLLGTDYDKLLQHPWVKRYLISTPNWRGSREELLAMMLGVKAVIRKSL